MVRQAVRVAACALRPGEQLRPLELAARGLEELPERHAGRTRGLARPAVQTQREVLDGGLVIFGGGAPKNFLLQTEPQLQEILGVSEKGHDYFLAVTDARPDTGGLSGATPAEAVSWGKVKPSVSAMAVIVEAVPMVMQCPGERAMPSSISSQSRSVINSLMRAYSGVPGYGVSTLNCATVEPSAIA